MPYTFGGATTDDITWGMGNNLAQSGTLALVTGWWRPTTLTATRGLWSIGNVAGAEIDTTTTNVRLGTDNTTDGQWTFPAGLVVNEWRFLAMAVNCNNTGPVASWRAWTGSPTEGPVEQTVTTVVAPASDFLGSATFYVGNKGTGSLAFQGDIADVCVFGETALGDSSWSTVASRTVPMTQAEADYMHAKVVVPLWEGRYYEALYIKGGNAAGVLQGCYGWNRLQGLDQVERPYGNVAATINGATVSANGAPRPPACGSIPLQEHYHRMPVARRRG